MVVQTGLVNIQLNSGDRLKWRPLLICHLALPPEHLKSSFYFLLCVHNTLDIPVVSILSGKKTHFTGHLGGLVG